MNNSPTTTVKKKGTIDVKQPDWWIRMARDSYVLAGRCKECGKNKPVNKHGICEFCDKVMLDWKPTETVLSEHDQEMIKEGYQRSDRDTRRGE